MRIKILTIALLFLVFIAKGDEKQFLNSLEKNAATFLVKESSVQKIYFEVDINSYELEEVLMPKGLAYKLVAQDASPLLEMGSPDLPKLAQSFIIPDKEKMALKIIGRDFIEIGNIEIAPSKGNLQRSMDPTTIEYTWNDTYTKDEFYPKSLGELNDPYIFRDFRGQTVWIYPYQYNPVQKVLRIYTKLEIEISNTGEPGMNQKIHASQKLDKSYSNIYQKQFLNYKSSAKYAPIFDEGKMLVVSHPDFMDAMQEFVAWKRQKGMDVEMVSLDSIGYASILIKNFVKEYYLEKGLTFLLLVGDSKHISPLYKSGDSDAAYGQIEGDDSYPEVFVGRFSAESDLDLAVQIQRTLFYERDIDENADWLGKAIGIASNEGGVGIGDDDEKDRDHMNFIREDLLSYGHLQVDQIYDPGAYALKVQEAINEGRGLINYVGHGSNTEWVTSGFDPSEINELENEYKYPYIFDVACVNGNFKGLTCFAEAFVRAHNDSVPTGAVAIIASTINQDWAPPMDAQDEMVDILVESYDTNVKRSFGGVTINGCMHMNDNYGASGSAMTDTWTIFGDPSLILRTKQPEKMVVAHTEVIISGMASFSVECDVDSAYAVLSNSDSIIGAAYVVKGKVDFDISTLTTEFTATLTLTAYNKVTYQTTLDVVVAEGPYIVVNNIQFNDQTRIANGQLEYNEEVTLDFELENVGLSDAFDLTATLVQYTHYVTMHSNCENQTIGTIASGEVLNTSDKFTISISDSVFNQMNLRFELVITSGASNESWTRELNFKVNSPDISIAPLSFIEEEGDNNNRVDAGEKVQLSFNLTNFGNADAHTVDFKVETESPYFVISQRENSISNLDIDSTYQITVQVDVNASTPVGITIPVFITVNSGLTVVDTQFITVGAMPILELGEGTEESSKYPFYNYYASNRTQIIYTVDDVGTGQKTFDAISLFITRFPANAERRILTNFKIKAYHTAESEFLSEFITTEEATTIFEGDYILPGELGELKFDVNPFEYNGTDNLILEFIWGENDYFVGSDSYKTQCSLTENVSVAYGYKDNTSNPSFIDNSKVRPNTVFHFMVDEIAMYNVVFEVVNSNYNFIHQDATVHIGGMQLITDLEGKAYTNLAAGSYFVSADAGYAIDFGVDFDLNSDNQTVVIDMIGTSVTEAENTYGIYPNPATGMFTVIGLQGKGFVDIYTISGQFIKTFSVTISDEQIDISDLPEGIYIVKIKSSSISSSHKLIVK